MELNKRIFYLLEQQGKTASDLAKHLGIKPSSITGWKLEGSFPSSKYIAGISEFLNVSFAYLITGNEDTPKGTLNPLRPDEQTILDLYNHLDQRQQGKVEALLEQMVNTQKE